MSFPRLNGLLAICWIGCALGSPSGASASSEAHAVLFLEEDEPGRPAYAAMIRGFRQTLEEKLPGMVSIYPENLDLARFSNPDYRDQAGQWLRQKYRDKEIDAVVASGPTSMELAQQFRRDFWPDAKIVGISGVGGNLTEGGPRKPADHVVRLVVGLDVAGTLDAARALMPEASRLVVVMGAKAAYADMNEWILREAEVVAARHGLAVESLAGLSLAETRHRLSLLPRDVIVLYGAISRDGEGRTYIPRDALEDLSRTSGAPIFGMSDTFIGYGITGGSVLRMEELGRELATMTAESIHAPSGEAPASRESRAYGIQFDWRELQRFGLLQHALPDGVDVRFTPPSLWENHRNEVLAGVTLLAGQSALILAFIIQFRRRKRAEQKVLVQRDQLAHVGRVSALGQLAASIAHDLNQPLGAILRNAGAAERLLQKTDPDIVELRAILADIRADDSRASNVIERMRALLTRHPLTLTTVDLKELLHEAADLLRYEAMRRGIELKVVAAPGLASVHGDRVHLQQMVINLVLNAMDALEGNPDGRVVMQANPEASGSMILLRIRDNGPGISESIRGSLFEPFQTTKPTGMGMGLAISQTIAEAHDGRLGVEHSGPEGTCFCCTLHPAPSSSPA
jgi:signal transduction histidine kinase